MLPGEVVETGVAENPSKFHHPDELGNHDVSVPSAARARNPLVAHESTAAHQKYLAAAYRREEPGDSVAPKRQGCLWERYPSVVPNRRECLSGRYPSVAPNRWGCPSGSHAWVDGKPSVGEVESLDGARGEPAPAATARGIARVEQYDESPEQQIDHREGLRKANAVKALDG